MSVNTIPFADSDSLFTVTLDSCASIRTTVTAFSSDAAAWISDVIAFHSPRLDSLIVGLDCEWRPNFSARHENPVALLQLCVGHRCLLFQLLHSDAIPPQLLAFLSDPRFKFVGVGIDEDVEKLIEDYEISVKNTVDLRSLAAERMRTREAKQMGLKKLAQAVMGVEVRKPKKVTMSRWDQAVLMLNQIGYACIDAFLSFEIGRRLYAGEFPELSASTISGIEDATGTSGVSATTEVLNSTTTSASTSNAQRESRGRGRGRVGPRGSARGRGGSNGNVRGASRVDVSTREGTYFGSVIPNDYITTGGGHDITIGREQGGFTAATTILAQTVGGMNTFERGRRKTTPRSRIVPSRDKNVDQNSAQVWDPNPLK